MLSPISMLIGFFCLLKGNYYPFIFLIVFDLVLIVGDLLLPEDKMVMKNAHPFILNLSLYLNLPLLLLYIYILVFIMGDTNPAWFSSFFNNYLYIDVISAKNNIQFLDKIAVIIMGSFNVAMGINIGHELTHRKKNKFDMFVGNTFLSMAWDCTFAIEHVHGHHKNIGLADDPATAKRGENLYMFILRGIKNQHIDAWKIEISRLRRREKMLFGHNNKMLRGYVRSSLLTILSYLIGGVTGLCFFLLWAFLGKCLLETVNYMEHYGLVREEGKPVFPRHSWNSNALISSLYLYNLTRHSSHHEKASLQFWELKTYKDAPKMPFGYLTCIYIVLFFPFIYHRIMAPKLIEWDNRCATDKEREIAKVQNMNSGVSLLQGS